MRKSEERLLVTHVGSLPRGGPLNELLIQSELDETVDHLNDFIGKALTGLPLF